MTKDRNVEPINKDEFKKLVEEWYNKNETETEEKFWKNKIVKVGGKKFILEKKFKSKDYLVVLGYYLYRKRLQCRHFYKSRSESFWRVGTGFRHGGAWVKGAERHKDKMRGGYIFEGQVHYELNAKLEEMDLTVKPGDAPAVKGARPVFDLFSVCNNNCCYKIKEYMVAPKAPKDRCSKVVEAYAEAREKRDAISDKKPEMKKYFSRNQVWFQKSVKRKTHGVCGPDSGIAALVENEELWMFINKCLKEEPVKTYEFRHELLDRQCAVETFRLKIDGNTKVFIEIAYSAKMHFEFENNFGQLCRIDTPICWVKSVYIGDSVSTYGDYKIYPQDLCFLVQKPMDYPKQVSDEIARRMGVEYVKNKKGKIIDYKYVNKKMQENVVSRKYLVLALYNEEYSPLIQAFKKQKKFPLFRRESKRPGVVIFSGFMRKLKSGDVGAQFESLKGAVLAACGGYRLNDIENGNRDGHGERRKEKVKKFEEHVQDCEDYSELNRAIYLLFAKNKVGATSCCLVGIRIKPKSFFSYFCAETLSFFQAEFKELQINDDRLKDEYERYPYTAANSNALERFVLMAIGRGLFEEERLASIRDDSSEHVRQLLLDAIKGSAKP